MKINHTILMVERNGDAEVTYTNVVSYTGLYGCLIRLELSDGSTATFENSEWLMFDFTPTRGWNSNACEINKG